MKIAALEVLRPRVLVAVLILVAIGFSNCNQNCRTQGAITFCPRSTKGQLPGCYTKDGCTCEVEKIINLMSPATESRLLQTSGTPRNMRIRIYFPDDIDGTLDDGMIYDVNTARLQRQLAIATTYYSKVAKVYPFAASVANQLSEFAGLSCGNRSIPAEVTSSFFPITQVDSIILAWVGLFPASTPEFSNILATAGNCIFTRRPIISQLNINASLLHTYLSSTPDNYRFHVQTTIMLHELGHIYSIGRANLGQMYQSPTSNVLVPQSQVFQQVGTATNGQPIWAFIREPVLSYVRNLFGCPAGVGAYFHPGQRSHWHSQIYDRELMIPSIGVLDNRITALTLGFAESTNWYYSIDYSLGWESYRGSNQGCDFLEGTDLSYDASLACSPIESLSCDLLSNYGGRCGSNGVLRAITSSSLCLQSSSAQRCFQVDASSTSCLKAICLTEATISVSDANGNTGICTPLTPTITLGGITFNCPSNFTIFCSAQICTNWCNQEGLCVDGICHLVDCSSIIGCLTCKRLNDGSQQCNQCFDGLTLQDNGSCTLIDCSLLPNCATCELQTTAVACLTCLGDYIITATICQLPACNAIISNCVNCVDENEDSLVQCGNCDAGFFPSADFRSCIPCGNAQTGGISECLTCSGDSSSLTCDSCNSGFFVNGGLCTPCNDATNGIPECLTCSGDSSSLTCDSCNSGFFVNGGLCTPCNDATNGISECLTCSGDSSSLTCDSCSPGFYVENGLCVKCSAGDLGVANCLLCSVVGVDFTCSECAGDLEFSAGGCFIPAGSVCSDVISNCDPDFCGDSNLDTFFDCTQCSAGYFVADDLLSCNSCSNITNGGIKNCATCHVDAGQLICDSCSTGTVSGDGSKCVPKLNCSSIPFCTSCSMGTSGQLICNVCQGNRDFFLRKCRSCSVPGCAQGKCYLDFIGIRICRECVDPLELFVGGRICRLPIIRRGFSPDNYWNISQIGIERDEDSKSSNDHQ